MSPVCTPREERGRGVETHRREQVRALALQAGGRELVDQALGAGVVEHLHGRRQGVQRRIGHAEGVLDGLERRAAGGDRLQPHLLAAEPGQRLGLIHRLVEAAHLVDQAEVLGLGAGPDPALGDLANPVRRQMPAVGDPLDEAGIDLVDRGAIGRPLLWREFGRRAVGVGILAADADVAHVDAELGQGRADHELAAEDPDGAGQRCRLGDDGRGLGGDPVAA